MPRWVLAVTDDIIQTLCECQSQRDPRLTVRVETRSRSVSRSVVTHGQEPPHDGGRGEAGEHVVRAREVREVGQQDALAPALAPHVHLAALGLCGRRVRGVRGGDLHDPAGKEGGGAMRGRGEEGTAGCMVLLVPTSLCPS